MKRHSLAIAVLLALGAQAQADTISGNGYTLDFTGGLLGGPSWWDVGSDGRRVQWTVPTFSVSGSSLDVTLPDYTLTADAGQALSAISLFVGNLSYFELAGGSSGATLSADIWADGWTGSLSLPAARTELGNAGAATGFYAFYVPPLGMGLHQVKISNLKVSLEASATAAIVSQGQAVVDLDFSVSAVPEPQTYAMLLSGIAVVGWVARRRRRR